MNYDIKSDLHTHTVFSHGKNTIEQNVRAAIEKGLKAIAITDHGPGHPLFGVRRKNIIVMRKEIDRLNDKYEDINILLGLEANLMSVEGETDIEDKYLKYYDILLMGYHKLGFRLKELPSFIIFPKFSRQKWADNIALSYKKAMQRYPIDIITHPNYGIHVNIDMLSKFAAENDVALEVNNSHMSMSLFDIKTAAKNGAVLSVNSDAHRKEYVGDMEKGLAILKKAEIPPEKILNTLENPVFKNRR